MNQYENNAYFWQKLDTLFVSSNVSIERPAGTRHPLYSNLLYPVDYGYLLETGDGGKNISLFKGSTSVTTIQTIVIVVDILKKELEVKVLISCNEEEELSILRFLNQTEFQKVILVRRGNEVPEWALDE